MSDFSELTVQVTQSDGRVVLSGEATIIQAEEMKHALLSCLKHPGDLVLDVRGLTSVDSTFFQMLNALKKTLTSQKRSLQLIGEKSPVFNNYASRVGLANQVLDVPSIDGNTV